jgi:Ca2+-binding EF-hand superfamily protein
MPRRGMLEARRNRLARTLAPAVAIVACGIGLAPAPGSAEGVIITEQLERAMFRAADLDGDGLLDEAELAADVIAAFVALDANGDGVLTPDELIGVSEATFARIDSNGDGVISLDEVRLHKLNAFAAADRDMSGQVSMAEMLFRTRRGQ